MMNENNQLRKVTASLSQQALSTIASSSTTQSGTDVVIELKKLSAMLGHAGAVVATEQYDPEVWYGMVWYEMVSICCA